MKNGAQLSSTSPGHWWRVVRHALLGVFAILLSATALAQTPPTTKVTYFHNDVSGSPMVATDATGNLVWKENYRPYGDRVKNEVAGSGNKVWFAGKPQDGNTGLSYMGARYYDPVVGRFMGVDPKGVNPGDLFSFNRYAYGNNNPYKYIDPDGRASALAYVIPVVLIAIVVANEPVEQREKRYQNYLQVKQAAANALSKAWGIFNESTDDAQDSVGSGASNVPTLPDVLVGDQSDPRAGPSKRGGKHTSGPLKPEHGGSGDFEKDLEKLTGGTRPWQPGDKAPPGSLVGSNGIFGRPENSEGGKSIDIPARGNRPHETLHYP